MMTSSIRSEEHHLNDVRTKLTSDSSVRQIYLENPSRAHGVCLGDVIQAFPLAYILLLLVGFNVMGNVQYNTWFIGYVL